MIIYWIYSSGSSGSPIKTALLCGTVGSSVLFVTEFKIHFHSFDKSIKKNKDFFFFLMQTNVHCVEMSLIQ